MADGSPSGQPSLGGARPACLCFDLSSGLRDFGQEEEEGKHRVSGEGWVGDPRKQVRTTEQPRRTCPGTSAGVREGFQSPGGISAPKDVVGAGAWPPSPPDRQLAPMVTAGDGRCPPVPGTRTAGELHACLSALHVGSVCEEAPPGQHEIQRGCQWVRTEVQGKGGFKGWGFLFPS